MRGTPPLLALLLLASAAVVQAAPVGELEAAWVQAEGATSVLGPLAVLRSDHRDAAPADGTLGSLHLEATALRVETDYRHEPVTVAGSSPYGQTEHRHTVTEHDAAVVHTERVGDTAYFFLAPMNGAPAPQVTVDTTHGIHAADSNPGTVAQYDQWMVDGRTPLGADVTGSLRVQGEGSVRYTVTGDFLIALWDWDLTLRDANGTHEVQSGEEYEEHVGVPGSPVRAVEESHIRLAYLFVTDGRLVLDIELGRDVEAYLSRADAQTGALVLYHARGRLSAADGPLDVRSPALRLSGDLHSRLDPLTNGVSVQIDGSNVQADYNGNVMDLAPASLPDGATMDSGRAATLALIGFLGLVAAAWILVPATAAYVKVRSGFAFPPGSTIRSRLAHGWAFIASDLLEEHPRAALAAANLAAWADRRDPDHRYMRLEANQRLHRHRPVLRDYRAIRRTTPHGEDHAWLLAAEAAVHCTMGETGTARALIEEAERMKPGVLGSAAGTYPSLRLLAGELRPHAGRDAVPFDPSVG